MHDRYIKDMYENGVVKRRIDHVRVGDRLDLEGDRYADWPDEDQSKGFTFAHPEFADEFQTVTAVIREHPKCIRLEFEAGFTCSFPPGHWVEVDGEQFRQDDEETPVLFRATSDGEVTAVFPTIPGSHNCMSCYSHIGQHGSCSRQWLQATRPARVAEYKPLMTELQGAPYGYRLKVYKRVTRRHREELMKANGR